MTSRVPDAIYSKLAVECTKGLLGPIDPAAIAKVGWDHFVKDVFDLTDSLVAELERRLQARQPKEETTS